MITAHPTKHPEEPSVSIGVYMIRDATACAAPDLRVQAGTQLLRLALAHHLGTATGVWRIGRAANGARIVSAGPGPVPALSVTHSGAVLAVAVTRADGVGIDIERPRPRNYAKIARHLGWPDSLWAQAGNPTPDEFLHVWTLWEALFKATPDGSLAELRAALSSASDLQAGTGGTISAAAWSGCSRRSPDGSWLSLVTQSTPAPATRLFRVDRLADDVDSARIETIPAPEGEFHF